MVTKVIITSCRRAGRGKVAAPHYNRICIMQQGETGRAAYTVRIHLCRGENGAVDEGGEKCSL